MSRTIPMTIVLVALGASGSVAEEEWGNVTMRFGLDGEAKPPAPFKVMQDPKICGEELFDESLLVNPKDRGIANVVVWLVPDEGEKLAVHPSYEESAKAKVTLQTKACRFEPRIVLLRTTQTLVEMNADPIGHNFVLNVFINRGRNDLLPSGERLPLEFPLAENAPNLIHCGIHPWMSGQILIRDNPYMAVSDKSGNLKLTNLPVGKRTLRLWHERRGFLSDVQVDKADKTGRGRLTLDVAKGENDLGEVRVPVGALEPRR